MTSPVPPVPSCGSKASAAGLFLAPKMLCKRTHTRKIRDARYTEKRMERHKIPHRPPICQKNLLNKSARGAVIVVVSVLLPWEIIAWPRRKQTLPGDLRNVAGHPVPPRQPIFSGQKPCQSAGGEGGAIVTRPGSHRRQEVDLVVPPNRGLHIDGKESLSGPVRRRVWNLAEAWPTDAQ